MWEGTWPGDLAWVRKQPERKVELWSWGVSAELWGVPAVAGIWVRFSPVGLVTVNLLGVMSL